MKTICDLLFAAKINALDSVRRVRVSADDKEVPDYTELPARTNEMAVLTPYEVTFRCFSSELAQVLTGFAYSPHGFIVKTVSIDPASALAVTPEAQAAGPAINSRFFGPPGLYRGVLGTQEAPMVQPVAPVTPAVRGGLQTVLNERPLRVTMVIEVVKLTNAGN